MKKDKLIFMLVPKKLANYKQVLQHYNSNQFSLQAQSNLFGLSFFSLDSADPSKLQSNLLQVFSQLLWADTLQHNANGCQDGSECHHVASKSVELLGMEADRELVDIG